MRIGESAEVTGPLGNCWQDFLPSEKRKSANSKAIALVAGGVGIAPLSSLASDFPKLEFDYYFGVKDAGEETGLLGQAAWNHRRLLVAAENGDTEHRGRITGFFDPAEYALVLACGPEPMLKAAAAKCREAAVPCFISMERRMACGAGACLGCAVATTGGNRRCCADGPIFNAEEVLFDG
jgi:NAD(P)H-flavin reductase